MATKPKPEEIIEILKSKNFNKLKGLAEHSQFDAKQKYSLDTDRGKYELAKDVSAMANGEGGVLVVGLTTKVLQDAKEEVVEKVSLLVGEEVDKVQYMNLASGRIYPNIKGLNAEWFPSDKNHGMGLLAIVVPEQSADDRPFLIQKVVGDDGSKLKETIFSYVFRVTDQTKSKNIQTIHALIKGGENNHRLSNLIEGIPEAVAGAIRRVEENSTVGDRGVVQSSKGSEPNDCSQPAPPLDEKIKLAIGAAGLENRPSLAFMALPSRAVSIPGIFESSESDLAKTLRNPPKIRANGFDLQTTGEIRPVLGNLLRVGKDGPGTIIDLWRNGTLVFAVEGDGEYLCWRGGARNWQGINRVALIEAATNFATLAQKILLFTKPVPSRYILVCELNNALMEDQKLFFPVGRFATPPPVGNPAPKEQMHVEINWDVVDDSEERAAYLLLTDVYAWFGLTADNMWLTKEENGQKIIDTQAIKDLRG
ncbi:MAG: ATP-binding protein [Proteobacteria bacterium]|nr:ATP-binding protein [Pseudomonadota bacterium]